VATAKPVIEYFIDRAAADADLSSISGRRDMTGRVLAIIKRVPDRVEQALYLQQLARLVNVEERTLADALAHAPVVRRAARPTTAAGNQDGVKPDLPLEPLEAEALELVLRYPTLAAELPTDEPMPFREAVAVQLATALRERATARADDGEVPATNEAQALDAWVGTLDAASAGLARELLATAAAGHDEPALDTDEAREVLHTCLLRLRVERIDESLRDGRLLLEEAQREGNPVRLAEIEQRIDRLGREKAEATRAIRAPATLAGTRR
jgi:DNA primase